MIHHLNSYNKDKTVSYYVCSKIKVTGCTATAVVNKIIIENKNGENSTEEIRYIVNKCSCLEEHNHNGDVAGVISERILLEMAQKVEVKLFCFFDI